MLLRLAMNTSYSQVIFKVVNIRIEYSSFLSIFNLCIYSIILKSFFYKDLVLNYVNLLFIFISIDKK